MKEKIDVVFINPGNTHQVYQNLQNEFTAIEPPVFAGFIAKYLQLKGLGVAIIDVPALELPLDEVASMVSDYNPYLVVMAVYGYQPSASTQNMPAARAACLAIKNLRPDLKILITGTHPAALPGRTMKEEPVDFLCDGEGPITIYEACLAIKSGTEDYSKVPGLWRWNENKSVILSNPPALLIKDPDLAMPGIAWELLPMEKYRCHNWHSNYGSLKDRMPYASIITSLGCPYKCNFCCIQSPFKSAERAIGYKPSVNSYRLRSPENVFAEITHLVEKYGIRNIKIHDEMFVLNSKHVLGICKLIKERFGDSLNIWAYSRIDTAKEMFLEELRSAGFRWLVIGIESADSVVRDGADKSFNDDDIKKTVKQIQNAGINVLGNFIYGLPHDTYESMQRTFDFGVELQVEYLNIYCAMAYPGSELYTLAKGKGIPLPDDLNGPGWIGYSQHAYETFPLSTDTVSNKEVLRLRDEAIPKYFSNPNFLKLVLRKFGLKAIEHIERMFTTRLKRKLLGD